VEYAAAGSSPEAASELGKSDVIQMTSAALMNVIKICFRIVVLLFF
jgi:hypothetical protein